MERALFFVLVAPAALDDKKTRTNGIRGVAAFGAVRAALASAGASSRWTPLSMSARSSVRLAIFGFLTTPLSCGAGARAPESTAPPSCPSDVYVAPSGTPTTTMSVAFEVRVSDKFALVGYCLFLDEGSLLTTETAVASVPYLWSREPVRWEGPMPRDGEHAIRMVILLRGTGHASGYKFEVKTSHRFKLKGDGSGPSVRAVLFERDDEPRMERSLSVEWLDSVGVENLAKPKAAE